VTDDDEGQTGRRMDNTVPKARPLLKYGLLEIGKQYANYQSHVLLPEKTYTL